MLPGTSENQSVLYGLSDGQSHWAIFNGADVFSASASVKTIPCSGRQRVPDIARLSPVLVIQRVGAFGQDEIARARFLVIRLFAYPQESLAGLVIRITRHDRVIIDEVTIANEPNFVPAFRIGVIHEVVKVDDLGEVFLKRLRLAWEDFDVLRVDQAGLDDPHAEDRLLHPAANRLRDPHVLQLLIDDRLKIRNVGQ